MSSNKEKEDMDCTLPTKKIDEIWLRILSGVCAIPLAIAATYKGPPYFDIVAFLILAGLLREWSRLATFSLFHPFCASALFSTALVSYGDHIPTWGLYIGISASILAAQWIIRGERQLKISFQFIAGCFYLCASVLFFLSLAHKGVEYRWFIVWLLTIVWSTDTGAYFIGKLLKGPKLAPRISPSKTWSGFFGGTLCGVIGGGFIGQYLEIPALCTVSFWGITLALSCLAHVGDLLESYMKRYYGVKDAGAFLPGHGGLLDRLDSLLFISLISGVFMLLGWVR